MARQNPSAALQQILDAFRDRARQFRGKYAGILRPSKPVADPFEGQPAWQLPEGTLFVSNGKLYQVIETGGGFNFAKLWGKPAREKFALDPQSIVARFYPVVAYGEPLPPLNAKTDLLDSAGRVLCFIFSSSSSAEQAARLDEATAARAGLRLQGIRTGLLGLTDGLHVYRLYAHQPPSPEMFERLNLPGVRQVVALSASNGPYYWAYVEEASGS